MFKKLASEALGISDIGRIVPPSDYDKVEADDYVLHEDGEEIYFLIKSKKDEYCFTDRALIHVDGDSAISSKRTLRRYEYYRSPIANVALETAGTVDLDAEIKFTIGEEAFSVDVDKRQATQLADLYKALYAISLEVSSNARRHATATASVDKALGAVADSRSAATAKSADLEAMTRFVAEWLNDAHDTYVRKDFGAVFEKYINN